MPDQRLERRSAPLSGFLGVAEESRGMEGNVVVKPFHRVWSWWMALVAVGDL
jgi:hypothetical protein